MTHPTRRAAVIALGIAVAVAAMLATPARADAQLLKRIKDAAKEKIADKVVKKTEDRILETSAGVVDSAAGKTGRGLDSVVTKTGAVADRAVTGTANAVAGLAGRESADDALAKQLAAGRLVLGGLRFAADGTLDPSAQGGMRTLAKLINGTTGAFLIEGHAAAGATAQALSESHARAVKAGLVAAGVDASRLFVMGFGATRPPTAADVAAERIEIARMQ